MPQISNVLHGSCEQLCGVSEFWRSRCCRDIKPENFLLTDKTQEAMLKLCDFGLSAYW